MWIIYLLICILTQAMNGYIISKDDRMKNQTAPDYEKFISSTSSYVEKLLENYPPKDPITGKYPTAAGDITIVSSNEFSYSMEKPVGLWMRILKLVSIDTSQQTATIIMREKYIWHDSNLMDPNFLGLKENETDKLEIQVPIDKIWIPPVISIFAISRTVLRDPGFVRAKANGHYHLYNRDVMYTIPCRVNVQSFPFDTHNCTFGFSQEPDMTYKLRLDSFILDKQDVNVFWNITRHESIEWDVIDWNHYIRKLNIDDGGSEDAYHMDELVVNVVFKRNSWFYSFVFIVPIVFLNALSLVIFKLPINSKDKDDFAKSLILTYFVLLTSIVDKSPTTGSSIPLLGVYIVASILVLALSLGLCLLVVDVHEQYMLKHKEMPRFLARIVESKCSMKLFGSHYKRHIKHNRDHELKVRSEVGNDDNKGTLISSNPPNISPKLRNNLRWKSLQKLLKCVFCFTIMLMHIIIGCTILFMATAIHREQHTEIYY